MDLPAQGWLRRMQPLLRRDRHAAFFRDGDEVSEVSELHDAIPEKYGFDLQSLSPARQHDLHHEQRQPKYPNPAATPAKIRILGKAQQAYVANRRGKL